MMLARSEVVARPRRALTNVVRRRPEGPPVAAERSAAPAREIAGPQPLEAERETALIREAPGPLPPGFVVPGPETLGRLDDHDCIVVLMMENRSYDHFFHDLPLAYPDKGYAKPPDSYRNTAPPGFTYPFSVVRNINIGLGDGLIFRESKNSIDPNHDFPHTQFQIGGGTEQTKGSGAMKGFVADLALESGSPQIAIGYFGMEDLPVFRALANWYPVCDRWFAALPVGTYPNRLTSLQGNVSFLFNIHMDDPSLGYFEDYSIFDLMDSQGISWKFFESDIGTLRLYDRYRLNVSHVRPIHELEATLRAARQGSALPRVMFIEPHFLAGNDDHPPMDIQQGQKFIRQVIGNFIEHGQLHRTLFVITYDEHGGFFDHVPPPGTPAAAQFGDPVADAGVREYGPIESLYTRQPTAGEDSPINLGVRVPSLVLSKYASARADHTVLDHTAILKTVLLHNRDRISTQQFTRFGERVMKRNHLGQVLDLQSPRQLDYPALSAEMGYRNSWADSLPPCIVSARAVGLTATHPASVLRGIALPRGRRVFGS
jgi:phospholipase C